MLAPVTGTRGGIKPAELTVDRAYNTKLKARSLRFSFGWQTDSKEIKAFYEIA